MSASHDASAASLAEQRAAGLAFARRWKAEGRFEQIVGFGAVYPLRVGDLIAEPGNPTAYGGPTVRLYCPNGRVA